jgi:hypothetical protein
MQARLGFPAAVSSQRSAVAPADGSFVWPHLRADFTAAADRILNSVLAAVRQTSAPQLPDLLAWLVALLKQPQQGAAGSGRYEQLCLQHVAGRCFAELLAAMPETVKF